jgi:hypothetical protein
MKINEYQKKRYEKVMDAKVILNLKLYPPLGNTLDACILQKGRNILEYWVKANALFKARHSRPLSIVTL